MMRHWIPAVIMSVALSHVVVQGDDESPPRGDIEREVRANRENIPLGQYRLGVLGYPSAYLDQVADRIIRLSYREAYQQVYDDLERPADPERAGIPVLTPLDPIILRSAWSANDIRAWNALPETRPEKRSFRIERTLYRACSPVIDRSRRTAQERAAIDMVARELAHSGLLRTTIMAAAVLDTNPQQVPRGQDLDDYFHGMGLPVDLLAYFQAGNQGVLEGIVGELHACTSAETRRKTVLSLLDDIGGLSFHVSRDEPAFRVALEDGSEELGMLHLQVTRGTYWKLPGSGGSLDVVRQLAESLPDVHLALSLEEDHLETFLDTASSWQRAPGRMSILLEPGPMTQWAQDNKKAGTIIVDQAAVPATLLPRYASRGDDGSTALPGDSRAGFGLARISRVLVSPLLFQGGNILAVHDPAGSGRLLLVGEGEIYRNVALGLSADQVRELFRSEFGVDRVAVLPSTSFHLDYDISIRRADGPGRSRALVNDHAAIIPLVLRQGIKVLADAGHLDPQRGDDARNALAEGAILKLAYLLNPVLRSALDGSGRYPLTMVQSFASDPADSPVGNFQRFLTALDHAAAGELLATGASLSPDILAYFSSIMRGRQQRHVLADALRDLGFLVTPIPSLAEGDRSITALNGIQARGIYIMPAWGGQYASIDAAARAALVPVLGTHVRVVPILCGESQRRAGAVHCAASAYPLVPP